MGLPKHTVNGIVSLAISVAATRAFTDGDDGYSSAELLVSVAVSAFLSGFFTSYFASK